jgi:hypothetical protein
VVPRSTTPDGIGLATASRLGFTSGIEAPIANEPLMVLGRGFASRGWFEAACHVAHIDPPVLLYSAAPHTVMRLARTGYGIAVVPSQMMLIPREGIRTLPLIHRGASIGRWAMIAWDAQRFLAPYAKQFVNELVASVRRNFPGRDLVRRAPALRAHALPERFVDMRRLDPAALDPVGMLAALPPLIKGYLRLGGFVGDGAVIDEQFNTTDVCIVVKTDLVTEKYSRHYERQSKDTWAA